MEQIKFFWGVAYRFWPPCVRAVERLGFHNFRQKFLLGRLNSNFNKENLRKLLLDQGFEKAYIAWQDPGEVLSMRKIDKKIYQYHIRLFIDGEIRAHYEYSPEARPIGHLLEVTFRPEEDFFRNLLGDKLVVCGEEK